jgi:DNA helicase IV
MAKKTTTSTSSTDTTEMETTVQSLQNENRLLRTRISGLQDDLTSLRNEFQRTRQLIQEDMRTVVEAMEQKRIL